ncbi:MAG: hypothetical protein ACKOQ1_01990 [Actinomycetota bacterium]
MSPRSPGTLADHGVVPVAGDQMRCVGVAVTVTINGPTDVAMEAVTLTGRHSVRGTQNHVPTRTT